MVSSLGTLDFHVPLHSLCTEEPSEWINALPSQVFSRLRVHIAEVILYDFHSRLRGLRVHSVGHLSDDLIIFSSRSELMRVLNHLLRCGRGLSLWHVRLGLSHRHVLWWLWLLLHGHTMKLHHLLLLEVRWTLLELTWTEAVGGVLSHALHLLGDVDLHVHLLLHSS